jgi:hypothetical protein
MEIIIRSKSTSLLEELVEAFKEGNYVEGDTQSCYIGDRTIEVNDNNKDLVIINID